MRKGAAPLEGAGGTTLVRFVCSVLFFVVDDSDGGVFGRGLFWRRKIRLLGSSWPRHRIVLGFAPERDLADSLPDAQTLTGRVMVVCSNQ